MRALLADVSRETIEKLHIFERLVLKWTPAINLISRESRDVLWDRHVLDSVQIFNAAPKNATHWVDLGAGGGFPGVIVAILAEQAGAGCLVTLIESDARKATFLRTALRETGVDGVVINDRIENVPSLDADVVSARALADLGALIGYAQQHLRPEGTAIFAKGARWKKELDAAKSQWNFTCAVGKSDLDADAAILCIKGVSRA